MFIFLLLTAMQLGAEESDKWQQARRLYYDGLKKKSSLQQAMALFSELAEGANKPAVAQTYLGSLTAVKAKYALLPTAKFKYANEGLALMDDGLAKSNDDLEALFIHGTTCYHLPFFFNRKHDAERSFRRILELLPQRFDDTPPELVRNALEFILSKIDLDHEERLYAMHLMDRLRAS